MNLYKLLIPVLAITAISCNNGPKVITAQTNEAQPNTSGIFTEESTPNESPNLVPASTGTSFTDNLHTVVATKTLDTKKYVYIQATENGKQFWIATAKQPIDIGKTYYYRNPLLKTNFESREHNRVFDTIYLVSNLVSHNHGAGNLTADFSENTTPKTEPSQKQPIETHTNTIIEHKGSLKIAEIVANPKQYEGKTVQLTGKVVKVNPNIMKRNWLHLQDGSKNNYDLVVTTNTFVPEGQTVTMRAKVTLNKDFGAGYRYDLILEDGVLVE
ncbi:MAG: hypothetical protein CMC70_06520 [Flavobacteriaceae bacterium]|nr:hypothetical protein [Flavobacteriaceae bacterium]